MILSWPSMFVQWKIPVRTVCFATATTGINTQQLREQLDHLHREAETTRAKASSARLRLMRLSEAAEKLQQQAAVSVQTGKENDARELLFQKNKVMQAMEKSKNRIELLDELSAKLNEVISVKETQLIGNVASDLEVSRDAAPTPVRIVSPKEEYSRNSTENHETDSHSLQPCKDDVLQGGPQRVELHNDEDLDSSEGPVEGNFWNEVDVAQSLKEISSYEDFLEHIDRQLNKIEDALNTFLTFSAIILESKKKLENSKVQQVMEILEDVHCMRGRIARTMQKEVEMR